MNEADDLLLLDEDDAGPPSSTLAWTVLVVDDDDEVHIATRIALRDEAIAGRKLALLHAYSRKEAEEILRRNSEIAVVLLDVVMEESDAGLRLVGAIRERFQNSRVRIILRTGQPGYAPELDVVRRYDINDYRTKSELTQVRLVTAVTAAIRSFAHLSQLERHRAGLELVVGASRDLIRRNGVASFAEGVLTQLSAILDVSAEGIVAAYRPTPADRDAAPQSSRFMIVGAAGGHANYVASPLSAIPDSAVADSILACVRGRLNIFANTYAVLYISSAPSSAPAARAIGGTTMVEGAVYVATGRPVEGAHRALVEVFAANVAAAFANVALFEELEHLAYHDTATGLRNRAGLLHALSTSGDRWETDPDAVEPVLALIDVADFGATNHHLGHDAGGALLAAIARRLETHVASGGLVARVGDDLFALVGPAPLVAPEALRQTLIEPFSLPSTTAESGLSDGRCDSVAYQRVNVRFAIGFAATLRGGGEAALRQASLALAHAKRGSSPYSAREAPPLTGFATFAPDLEERTLARLSLLRRLRDDIGAERLAVWFQPQIDFATGQLSGMEGLLRWPDGKGGFVATPDRFVPLAEQAGLIVDLGRWVLDASCAALASLRGEGHAIPRVSVNVSPHQFRSEQFVDDVRTALHRHGLIGRDLELEITESVALDDPEIVLATMQTLRERGVRFAIDDFGTGYASLGQLRRLPFDVLKIDRSFIRDLDGSAQRSLVETILALGAQMTLETVAEGVETEEHAATLRALGCTAGQGFLYSRALPVAELSRWIVSR
jgi:diguanylate cyclase (GGDEF)-like protein